MKKILITIVILIVAAPFIAKILPAPMSVDRVLDAFKASGYAPYDLREVTPPQRETVAHWEFYVDTYRIELLRYDSEGKVAKNYEYLKPGTGEAIVQGSGLAQSLGAAPSKNLPTAVQRKGKWLVYVQGEQKGICQSLAQVFKKS